MPSRSSWPLLAVPLLLIAYLPASAAGNAERGKYLVEEVAKCGDCHTPMGPEGSDREKWLKGAVLSFGPIQPVKDWHKTAPDLTSSGRLSQRWGESGLTKFLETGLGPSGHTADPPMPAYKMKPEDAQDIVAYLKTLK